jgi:hypothetical protein
VAITTIGLRDALARTAFQTEIAINRASFSPGAWVVAARFGLVYFASSALQKKRRS